MLTPRRSPLDARRYASLARWTVELDKLERSLLGKAGQMAPGGQGMGAGPMTEVW